jgi:hypothetical protein
VQQGWLWRVGRLAPKRFRGLRVGFLLFDSHLRMHLMCCYQRWYWNLEEGRLRRPSSLPGYRFGLDNAMDSLYCLYMEVSGATTLAHQGKKCTCTVWWPAVEGNVMVRANENTSR